MLLSASQYTVGDRSRM